jgi:hypothetical protein
MKDVSKNPLRRSTIPLDSGSKGLSPLQRGGQGSGERPDSLGMALAATDAGLVVPDQPPREPGPAAGAAPTSPAAGRGWAWWGSSGLGWNASAHVRRCRHVGGEACSSGSSSTAGRRCSFSSSRSSSSCADFCAIRPGQRTEAEDTSPEQLGRVSVELIGQRAPVRSTSGPHSAGSIHRAMRVEGEAGEAHLEPAERGTVAVDGDPVAVGSHAR